MIQLKIAAVSAVGLLALVGLMETVCRTAVPAPTPTPLPAATETSAPTPTSPVTIYIDSGTEDLWVAFPVPNSESEDK